MSGHLASVGAWEPVFERPIDALCDRFPSQGRSAVWAAAIGGAGALPFGNPPSFTELCRDKLVAQRVLEASGVEMPAVEADPARFRERLAEWGAAFLKPRYGSLGAGVRRVTVGDALPAIVEGLQGLEPALLQRAVPPPAGLAGCVIRLLLQREPDGAWVALPPVIRSSTEDPVVNVARGATVSASLPAHAALALEVAGRRLSQALDRLADAAWIVEVGADLCLDPDGEPHLIELNGRPRGRLAELAKLDPGRFQAAHEAALLRPLRRMAALGTPIQPSSIT
jgi:glutathione synthase/RimK-type ligase-like ATP-grasp enzyme